MKNFGKKYLEPATLGLALSASACAPVQPQPTEPEPIVVEIPEPDRALVEVLPEEPTTKRRYEPKTSKKSREEKIRYILANVTGKTRAYLESEIEQLKFIFPNRYAHCRASDEVFQAEQFAKEEQKLLEQNNPENFYFCNHQYNTVLDWSHCREEVYDKDRTTDAVRKYAKQLVIECMETRKK